MVDWQYWAQLDIPTMIEWTVDGKVHHNPSVRKVTHLSIHLGLRWLTFEIPVALESSPCHQPLIAQAFTFDFWGGAPPMLKISVMYHRVIYYHDFQPYIRELWYHVLIMWRIEVNWTTLARLGWQFTRGGKLLGPPLWRSNSKPTNILTCLEYKVFICYFGLHCIGHYYTSIDTFHWRRLPPSGSDTPLD